MAVKTPERKIIDEMGGPAEIHSRLVRYSAAVSALASRRAELTEKYPDQWVAMYQGEIACVATTLENLLNEIDKRKLPHEEVVIQFLDTKKKILVL